MASPSISPEPRSGAAPGAARWRRIALWLALACLVAALGAGAAAWFQRERLAGDLIDSVLAENGLEARYAIAAIGPRQQVIEDFALGDPAAPDLRARRITIALGYGWQGPFVERVTAEGVRLFGTLQDGALSFGALDPLLFEERERPAGLPQIAVSLRDAGAQIASDYGMIGASLEGEGDLADGFSGRLALTAPGFGTAQCSAQTLTAFGTLSTSAGAPRFAGPVRVRGLDCAGLQWASGDLGSKVELDASLSAANGEFALAAKGLEAGEARLARLAGGLRLGWREGQLTVSHELAGENLATPYARLAQLDIEGRLRSAQDFAQADWSASFAGEGLGVSSALGQALAPLREASRETLAEPLLARLEGGLRRAFGGARATGEINWRLRDGDQAIVVPQARIESRRGERVIALSRASWRTGEGQGAVPRLAGNILVGGSDLPQINGRMEQLETGETGLRLTMAPYRAGSAALAVPSLQVRQGPDGALRFAGAIAASGPIPGGFITGLEVPLEGRVSPAGVLEAGRACTRVRFGALAIYDLALESQSLRLCPPRGRAFVRYDGALGLAAETGPLALKGTLGELPATLEARRALVAFPGPLALEDVTARLGRPDDGVRLAVQSLTGELGETLRGRFERGDVRMDAVPLDFTGLSGAWAYEEGELRVRDARLVLAERTQTGPRFEPLEASRSTLTLAGTTVRANAILRHPPTQTAITQVSLRHDLAEGTGSALLMVDRLTFGDELSIDDLSPLAKGIIAYTEGEISGEGRIAWTPDTLTSSGSFGSDGLDLAATFGPVRGLKGTIEFSDLLGLTTRPDQTITIGAINPGIQVLAGRVVFSLRKGTIIDVASGRWPFMGGELIMRPVTLRYGTEEEQRYTFEIVGLDAAKFVAQMELANIGATGTFDGTLPIVFDANGDGRIEGGLLVSRLPGGNVSYVGELLYEDMGTVANYAFESLRSLDYRQMSVELGGDLAGEIITRFRIDGVRQGEGAARNFVTRRLAQLPIRFNINVRSENFYELATMVRTFIDADALPDPVDQGLLGASGGRFVRPPPRGGPAPPPPPEPAPGLPPAIAPGLPVRGNDEGAPRPADPAAEPLVQPPPVQPPESETQP